MGLDYRSLSQGELIRLIETRDRLHKARVHTEERYRNLMAQAADGIFIVNPEGLCLEVNRAGTQLLGRPAKAIIGRPIHAFVAKEDVPVLKADLASLRRKKTFLRERRFRRADGTLVTVEVRVQRLSDGRIQGIVRDITLRKQAEQALRQSEERFRSLTAAAFEGICISENGRIVDANDPFIAMFGFTRRQLVGRKIITLIAPKWRRLVARRIRNQQAGVLEHQLLRRDGSLFEAEARSKIITWRGRKVRVTALRDISDRKKSERALRESEEKFSKAFRASPDGLAISELESGRYIEVNEGYCRLYGYRRAEMLGRTSVELGIWDNPKDRARLVGGLKTAGKVRGLEVRTRTRQGGFRIVLLSAEPIEVGGKPCLVSVLHDVTDRVRVETALRASEDSLRATIEYTPNVAVQWFDARGRVLYWNRASEHLYGWTAAAARGKTLSRLIFAPAEAALFQRSLKDIVRTGKAIGPIEFPFHHRDGTPGIVLSTVFRIPVPTGEMRFVCMDVDLTERKAAEAEREKAVLREHQARAEYTLQLIGAQEAERARIAAELHDSLGQNLLLIKNRAQLALTRSGLTPVSREQIEGISHLAMQSIAEARQISHDLHPHQLDHLGLTRALAAMLDGAAKSSGIRFRRKLDNVDSLFAKDAAMNLYRIVQESVNNILKHSGSRRARVRLEHDVHEVLLRIEDDGRGFPLREPINGGKGLGLKNIAERVRILGGKLQVDSRPGRGTRIKVTIPTLDGK